MLGLDALCEDLVAALAAAAGTAAPAAPGTPAEAKQASRPLLSCSFVCTSVHHLVIWWIPLLRQQVSNNGWLPGCCSGAHSCVAAVLPASTVRTHRKLHGARLYRVVQHNVICRHECRVYDALKQHKAMTGWSCAGGGTGGAGGPGGRAGGCADRQRLGRGAARAVSPGGASGGRTPSVA